MKKLKHYILIALFLLPLAPVQLQANELNTTNTVKTENVWKNSNEKESIARLKDIRERAKTSLSKEERKALREEVKAIREKHRDPGGVIYISTGGLILIIILLIILL